MPRRSLNKSDSPVPRRQSARIAAASANKTPTPSPVKKTRRSSKVIVKYMCNTCRELLEVRWRTLKTELTTMELKAFTRMPHMGSLWKRSRNLMVAKCFLINIPLETTESLEKPAGSAQESSNKDELAKKDGGASKVEFEGSFD